MFTDAEVCDIKALRSRVQDICNHDELEWARSYVDDDSTMWRYVLAKSMEDEPLRASELMFRNSIAWRRDIGLMDKLPGEWRSEGGDGVRSGSARARFGDLCFYGGVITQHTVRGGPVLVERLGKIDLHGLYNDDYAFDCAATSYIMYLEDAWKVVRAAGNKVRGVIVIDVADCGLSMLGYMSVVKRICNAGVLHYPEISEKVNIVNAGWVLSILWDAIRPFLPARTQNKVNVISGNEAAGICDDVIGGRASLPQFLGGELSLEESGVCPGLSVDSAYNTVLEEILLGGEQSQDREGTVLSTSPRYADEKEFLEAALAHFEQNGADSKVQDIRKYLMAIS